MINFDEKVNVTMTVGEILISCACNGCTSVSDVFDFYERHNVCNGHDLLEHVNKHDVFHDLAHEVEHITGKKLYEED